MRVSDGQASWNDRSEEVLGYRFAGFYLSARQQRLEQIDGSAAPIVLSTKLYHMLLTFANHAGEVIGKDTIVEAVWPGQVVTDAALAKQMQRLRNVLGDGERDPPLIETHRGRGYRMTCGVDAEYLSPRAAEDEGARVEARPHRHLKLAGVLALVGAFAAKAVMFSPWTGTPVDSRSIALLPVSDQTTALSEGAAEYFATRLGNRADLAPLMASDNPPERATETGSLRLVRLREGPVAAVHLTRSGELYQLSMNLRTNETVASTTLTDASIQVLLESGSDWLAEQTGIALKRAPTSDRYAQESYFAGLSSRGCRRARPFLDAAVTSDPGMTRARLRLLKCLESEGDALEVASGAVTLAALAEKQGDSATALEAHLLAARAFRRLGKPMEASSNLETGLAVMNRTATPMQRMTALAAVAMLANMNGETAEALAAQEQRLNLARDEYPIPQFIADIHLDIAEGGLISGDYALMRSHAEMARELIEEFGDRDSLVRALRFLITSYFRANDMDAAVQLAFAAGPVVDRAGATYEKAIFMQFAAIALNVRGHLEAGRAYTARLRDLEAASANPMYGTLADVTVFHRLYVKGEFEKGYAFAASLRKRIDATAGDHSALPLALAFEALGASRGGPIAVARSIIDRLERDYAEAAELQPTRIRALAHVLLREGTSAEGVRLLRTAATLCRDIGQESVAEYIGYEIAEARLATEEGTPWDDLEGLVGNQPGSYQLLRLMALAHARDGNYVEAAAKLEKARLRGHELWSDEDQLLLEDYRSALATADSRRATWQSVGQSRPGRVNHLGPGPLLTTH